IFANCNFQGASVDLMNKPWPEDKVRSFFEEFVGGARTRRLSTYVHGVGSSPIAKAAGCDYMDGEQV
ncbi:MAG: hypothetical protein V3R66_02780, partial [Rhodospirillales bacterium]